jgi:hypothetical protein
MILALVVDLAVPFTNNQAEADLRPVQIQQRASGGTWRTLAGVTDFASSSPTCPPPANRHRQLRRPHPTVHHRRLAGGQRGRAHRRRTRPRLCLSPAAVPSSLPGHRAGRPDMATLSMPAGSSRRCAPTTWTSAAPNRCRSCSAARSAPHQKAATAATAPAAALRGRAHPQRPFRHSQVKSYLKCGRAFRIETVTRKLRQQCPRLRPRTAPDHRLRGDHAGRAGGGVRHCVDQIDARRAVVSRQPAGPLGDRRGPA